MFTQFGVYRLTVYIGVYVKIKIELFQEFDGEKVMLNIVTVMVALCKIGDIGWTLRIRRR